MRCKSHQVFNILKCIGDVKPSSAAAREGRSGLVAPGDPSLGGMPRRTQSYTVKFYKTYTDTKT